MRKIMASWSLIGIGLLLFWCAKLVFGFIGESSGFLLGFFVAVFALAGFSFTITGLICAALYSVKLIENKEVT